MIFIQRERGESNEEALQGWTPVRFKTQTASFKRQASEYFSACDLLTYPLVKLFISCLCVSHHPSTVQFSQGIGLAVAQHP